jgi:hypothetical protein
MENNYRNIEISQRIGNLIKNSSCTIFNKLYQQINFKSKFTPN